MKVLSYVGAAILFLFAMGALFDEHGNFVAKIIGFASFSAFAVLILPIEGIRNIKHRKWIIMGLVPFWLISIGSLSQSLKAHEDKIKEEDSMHAKTIEDSTKTDTTYIKEQPADTLKTAEQKDTINKNPTATESEPKQVEAAPAKAPTTNYSNSSGRQYHTGKKGGCYYYSNSGKKVYVDHSYCR